MFKFICHSLNREFNQFTASGSATGYAVGSQLLAKNSSEEFSTPWGVGASLFELGRLLLKRTPVPDGS